MANANLYFKFVDSTSKAGKTGLSVTANVFKLTKSGTKTTVATGASCAEVGGGVYAYNLSSPDFATYDYVATAAPSDATGLANADADAMWADFAPDVQSRIPAALTTDGNIKADALRLGGTLQTGRDIGASVLLSVGVGAGQVNLSSGTVPANVTQIAGQTASAAGTVTFPGAIGTSTLTAGAAMALTSGERDATAAVIESHLLNEGDGQMLVNAIVGAIGNTNLDQTAVVAAIRADLERTGGKLQLIDAKTTNLPGAPAAVGSAMTLTGDLTATMKTSISGLTIANVTTVATIGDSRIASILTAVTTPAATPTTDDIAAAVKTAIFSTAMYVGSTTPVYTFPQFGAIITRIDKRAGDTWGLMPPMSDQVRWTYYAAVETCTVDGSVITLYDGTTLTCTSAGRETVLAG